MKKFLSSNYTGLVLIVLALFAAYGMMVLGESDYLLRVQELNLFLYTPLFFKQQLVVAGGLLTYVGTWFTQFFFHPWLGALLLCVCMALMMWLVERAFRVPRLWLPLLLIPAALVVISDFNLGYWVFYLKLRGHFFIAVTGTSFAVALVWLFRIVAQWAYGKGNWQSMGLLLLFMAVVAMAAYPIAGFYGLLSLLLMAVLTLKLKATLTQKFTTVAFTLAALVCVPFIYYRNVYYQTSLSDIWWQALPTYFETEGFNPQYLTYVLLAVFLVVLAALYGTDYTPRRLKQPWMQSALQVVLTVAIGYGCWNFWFRDDTFREELQMNAAVEDCDWERVLTIMKGHEGEPTRMMVMYKNLDLFKLGRAGNEMYNYADGSKKPNTDIALRMVQLGGKNIYLHYGLPNFCYRWCLEDGVEYGWRAEYLKFLVRCALLNDEWQAARKYIDILKQTRYHREWAERYEAMATPQVAERVAADPHLGAIKHIMHPVNILGSDQSLLELFMLNLLAYRVTNDVTNAELALLAALQLKDIPAFWRAFNQYASLKKDGKIARHYQEAAFLYGNLEKTVDISHMPFDPSIPASFKAFMQAAQSYPGATEEQLKVMLNARFGNTFYYNYFLMRGLKTY